MYCNQMLFGSRRLRRRGGVAPVLRQVGQGSRPRRGGAARRHRPAARAAEPVRQHEARGRAGATSCCSGWPMSGTSRRRRPTPPSEADRHARPATQPPGIAPFFVEEVRKHLERQYGAKALYESGLRGHDHARRRSCRRLRIARSSTACGASTSGMAIGSRSATSSRKAHDRRLQGRALGAPDSGRRRRPGRRRHRRPRPARRALPDRPYHADLDARGLSPGRAARRPPISFKPGDLIEVEIRKLDEDDEAATVTLEQTPVVEGALVAIDNRTGQIKAMVGGWDFSRSKFNRAVQAYRQLGSTFKPIVYTAAIDRGFTPASILIDEPVSYSAGNGQTYTPAELRPQVRGPDHAASRARRVAQHSRRQDDGRARAEERPRLREAVRFRGGLPAVSADRARRRRRDAARSDERVHRVPESGRADEAVRGPAGDRPRRQPARREPRRAGGRHSRRHGVRDDEPAARRGAPRHRRSEPPA